MAALINALDSNTPIQTGVQERSWSSDLSEKILQLSFQMVRCDSSSAIESLSSQLRHILENLIGGYKSGHVIYDVYKESMTVLYKMIGYTRDIIGGKGEYALSYMQIFVWNSFSPELAQYALLMFVTSTSGDHPFGSWKDIKYFCNYCKQKYMSVTDPLIQYAFSLINAQLAEDVNATTKSLVAKWIPREKSRKFGWIYQELAYSYFKSYLLSAKTSEQRYRSQLKCKSEYRKLVSNLNRMIDTVQIKQCANNWADIDHSNTTSITISKQKHAFLNITKDNKPRNELEDRIICAYNFKNHLGPREYIKPQTPSTNVSRVPSLHVMGRLEHGCEQSEEKCSEGVWRKTGAIAEVFRGNSVDVVEGVRRVPTTFYDEFYYMDEPRYHCLEDKIAEML